MMMMITDDDHDNQLFSTIPVLSSITSFASTRSNCGSSCCRTCTSFPAVEKLRTVFEYATK